MDIVQKRNMFGHAGANINTDLQCTAQHLCFKARSSVIIRMYAAHVPLMMMKPLFVFSAPCRTAAPGW